MSRGKMIGSQLLNFFVWHIKIGDTFTTSADPDIHLGMEEGKNIHATFLFNK